MFYSNARHEETQPHRRWTWQAFINQDFHAATLLLAIRYAAYTNTFNASSWDTIGNYPKTLTRCILKVHSHAAYHRHPG